jgi:hypothetical protein
LASWLDGSSQAQRPAKWSLSSGTERSARQTDLASNEAKSSADARTRQFRQMAKLVPLAGVTTPRCAPGNMVKPELPVFAAAKFGSVIFRRGWSEVWANAIRHAEMDAGIEDGGNAQLRHEIILRRGHCSGLQNFNFPTFRPAARTARGFDDVPDNGASHDVGNAAAGERGAVEK